MKGFKDYDKRTSGFMSLDLTALNPLILTQIAGKLCLMSVTCEGDSFRGYVTIKEEFVNFFFFNTQHLLVIGIIHIVMFLKPRQAFFFQAWFGQNQRQNSQESNRIFPQQHTDMHRQNPDETDTLYLYICSVSSGSR